MTKQEELKKARDDGFTTGIAWSAGWINKYGGGPQDAIQLLSLAGIKDKKELREAGVDEFDLECIGDLLPEE